MSIDHRVVLRDAKAYRPAMPVEHIQSITHRACTMLEIQSCTPMSRLWHERGGKPTGHKSVYLRDHYFFPTDRTSSMKMLSLSLKNNHNSLVALSLSFSPVLSFSRSENNQVTRTAPNAREETLSKKRRRRRLIQFEDSLLTST